MDRATFEKIVGGATCNGNNITVKLGWLPADGLVVLNQGRGIVTINIEALTPFRLRCLLHGLGIKCDWDGPVTFERLMELDGAEWRGLEEDTVLFNLGTHSFEFTKCDDGWLCNDKMPTKTMRQVHLLLEAAGVGG